MTEAKTTKPGSPLAWAEIVETGLVAFEKMQFEAAQSFKDCFTALESIVNELEDGDITAAEQTARHAGKNAIARAKGEKT